MSSKPFLFWTLGLGVWCVQGSIYNVYEACKSSDCVLKCCPPKQISLVDDEDDDGTLTCVDSHLLATFGVKNPDDYSDVGVYNKDIQRKIIKTNKSVNNFKLIYVANFTETAQCLTCIGRFETYFLEDGRWTLRRRNHWTQWSMFQPGQFCIEHEVYMNNSKLESTTPTLVVWTTLPSESSPTNQRALTSAYGLMVSCVFLLLVLTVYALLPELRNLAGWILMACMSTYFAFFFVRIIHVFGNENEVWSANACVVLTVIFHYLMLATFCWMNVMSFDIWWTFRDYYRKSSQSHRCSVMSKFRWYCAYAWGLPVLPTLFVVIVDQLDLSHIPNFVQPQLFSMCYFEPEAHLLYVSIPILILICVNLILFMMSAFNIWQVKRGVDRYKDSATNQKEEHRLWVYFRLSLLMGVSWILEVIGNLVNTESVLWTISDLYNALVGLFIFLLFVCKKKIFLRLCARLSINNKLVEYVRARTEDSRAADAPTKSSTSHQTDTSDVEHWSPSYKYMKNKSEDL